MNSTRYRLAGYRLADGTVSLQNRRLSSRGPETEPETSGETKSEGEKIVPFDQPHPELLPASNQ